MNLVIRTLRAFGLGIVLCSLSACGVGDLGIEGTVPTDTFPIVMRVSPDSGAAGETITVFGVGYSIIPNENILFLGEGASAATSYGLVTNGEPGEAEQLTFPVPAESLPGDQAVVVLVNENTSNADLSFTVLP
jgi:hypothetical protein